MKKIILVGLMLLMSASAWAGTYEVWAGNENFMSESNWYDYYYNINSHGYVKLGSDSESARFYGNYAYYVVVANEHAGVKLDEVRAANGQSLSWVSAGNIVEEGDYMILMGEGSFSVYQDSSEGKWVDVIIDSGEIVLTYPDLVVTSTSPTSKTVNPGSTVSIAVTTKNNGPGNAVPSNPPHFETTLFLSTADNFASMKTSQLDAAELDSTEHEFSSLEVGASTTHTYTFNAPSAPGTYYIRAKADEFNSVTESNEENNWGELVTLKVTGAMPWLNLLLE
jgi:hypothetical protein